MADFRSTGPLQLGQALRQSVQPYFEQQRDMGFKQAEQQQALSQEQQLFEAMRNLTPFIQEETPFAQGLISQIPTLQKTYESPMQQQETQSQIELNRAKAEKDRTPTTPTPFNAPLGMLETYTPESVRIYGITRNPNDLVKDPEAAAREDFYFKKAQEEDRANQQFRELRMQEILARMAGSEDRTIYVNGSPMTFSSAKLRFDALSDIKFYNRTAEETQEMDQLFEAISAPILPFTGGGTTKKTGKKKQEKTVSPEGQISDDDLLRLMGGE